MNFENLDVAITGGTGALGTAVAERLVAAGATCHIPNHKAVELERFPLADHAKVHIETGVDLTDEASVAAFYDSVPSLWASINIAGGFAMAPLAETSQADAMDMLTMNTMTCFLSCREAVKAMRARPATSGAAAGGRIVNVAARPGVEPRTGGGMAAYAASKAAVAALTEALAEELAPEGIWVNAIAPSIIDTAANREAMPKAPHDKWPTPADIAETIAFLSSPQNGTTRGAIVAVYGKS